MDPLNASSDVIVQENLNQAEACHRVWILTTQRNVQSITSHLRSRNEFDRSNRIVKSKSTTFLNSAFNIPAGDGVSDDTTAIPTSTFTESCEALRERQKIVRELHLDAIENQDFVLATHKSNGREANTEATTKKKPICLPDIVREWLNSLPSAVQDALPCSKPDLISSSSWSYQIYDPMLLLSPSTFQHPSWKLVLDCAADYLPTLYKKISDGMRVSHIAINAPIPLLSSSMLSSGEENTKRQPTDLQPLFGDFGPLELPCPSAFERAFWVSSMQNGIYQVFSPRHVMFSKGNIKEKMRVLTFPDVEGATVVDLYAGIGYFAFPYAKAGAKTVLCWEINRWSVEGLKRGAQKNKRMSRIVEEGEEMSGDLGKERLVVFMEDNLNAAERVERLRSKIAPVRHVNCGYLPSSSTSWETALRVLHPEGGWVHAHENVADADIPSRTAEIEAIFNNELNSISGNLRRTVRCEHVEKVKTYAPGVIHCVFDMHIGIDLMPSLALQDSGT